MKIATRQAGRRLAVLACLAVVTPLIGLAGPAQTAPPAGSDAAAVGVVPAAPVALSITTDGGVPVVSKDDYVAGSMQLAGTTYALEIRGRGNSTWNWPKKPYKIKLAEAAGLLGLPAHEQWVLLANYADRTSLRDQLAMALGASTRLAWTPRTRYVDVTLNGTALGLYVLTDQVEQDADRVALPEGSYLLEIDKRFRAAGDPGFWTDRRTPVSYKDPDELTIEQKHQVRDAVNQFEHVLYGKDFADPRTGYAAYIDVPSVIDWYLVEELFYNQDSDFGSSVYVSWVPGRGLAMGPLWDFDLSAGSHWMGPVAPQGWFTRYGVHNWIDRMFDDPAFAVAVKRRWAELRPIVDAALAQIPVAADVIRPSALQNWAIWPTTTLPVLAGTVHADTFDGEVAFLKSWLTARATWMSEDEAFFGRVPSSVAERKQTIKVPVRVMGPRTQAVQVAYSWRSGSATPGKDFTMSDGLLEFQPGQTVRTFPITILGDRRAEGPETIRLQLTSTTGGPRTGDPAVITVTIRASDPGAQGAAR